jgi:hypothetical protein
MIALSPREASRIATGVYEVEDSHKGVSLGCEGFCKITDSSRFSGITGGHLCKRLSGFGYIAEGEGVRKGEVLIAIRGTSPSSGRDWFTDFRAGFCRGDSGHSVHIGFQNTWNSFAEDIRSFIRGKTPTHIHCVGHSLGGALATLCADYCTANRVGQVSLYTFGAPRVGTQSFAQDLTDRIGAENMYRLTHVADPVAVVPIYPFFHAPYMTRQYVVGGVGLPINLLAHRMSNYAKAMGQASSWSSLTDRSTTVVVADEVKLWLATVAAGGGVTAFSVDSLAMIGKALGWVLQQAYQGGGLGLGYGLTALDHLGYMVERGTKFSSEIEAQIKTLMNAILRFIGRSAVTVGNLTLAFVRYVLELFYSTIQTMALQALRGTHEQ